MAEVVVHVHPHCGCAAARRILGQHGECETCGNDLTTWYAVYQGGELQDFARSFAQENIFWPHSFVLRNQAAKCRHFLVRVLPGAVTQSEQCLTRAARGTERTFVIVQPYRTGRFCLDHPGNAQGASNQQSTG